MRRLFASDDQNTGASAPALVLPVTTQGWFPLRLTGLISLLFKGLSGVFSSTPVQRHQFFGLLAFFCSRLLYIGYISPFLLGLSLLFSAICKPSSDNHLAFWHFFFLGMILITASCIMLWNSVHNSSGTLSDLIPCICQFHCIIIRDLI